MRTNLLASRRGRKALFALLYLSEGAPVGFVWWALPTLLRARGVPVEEITSVTALAVLPWAFKFLWAPVVDFLRGPRFGFRGWILSMQTLMVASLVPLLWLDPVHHLGAWRWVLVLHAMCAATQDVAVDALAIRAVPAGERGGINGMMQLGLLAGRSLFGGGVLFAGSVLGLPGIVACVVACIAAAATPLLFTREPAELAAFRARSWFEPLGQALRGRATWLGLAFALTSGAAFEVAGALRGPFLLDRGVSQREQGLFLAFPVVLVTAVGGLLGGKLSDRYGHRSTVRVFLLGFVAAVALLAAADRLAPSPGLLLALFLLLYLFVGLFTVASYALFMDLTDPRIGATQFSAFMGATNGCESWAAWAGGLLAGHGGYSSGFLVMCVVSLLSLAVLRGLRSA